MNRDCSKDPCDLCLRRERGETCGSCFAGILIGVNGNEIQRCDECALFETDDDAVEAMRALGKLLHKVYTRGLRAGSFTVADAHDQIADDVQRAPLLRRRAARLIRDTHPHAVDHHRDLIGFAQEVVGVKS